MIGERGNEGYILAYPSSLRGHGFVRGTLRGNEGPSSLRGSLVAMGRGGGLGVMCGGGRVGRGVDWRVMFVEAPGYRGGVVGVWCKWRRQGGQGVDEGSVNGLNYRQDPIGAFELSNKKEMMQYAPKIDKQSIIPS